MFGFGIISGRFLTLLFMLFLSARLAVVHLGKIAFHGLQFPDTLFICPVLVVKGVLLGGKLLDFSLQRFIGGQLGNAFLPKISYGCVCYDKVPFMVLPVGFAWLIRFVHFQSVRHSSCLGIGKHLFLQVLFLTDSRFNGLQLGGAAV